MITADQITCHLIGDYVLQSDWMANQKTKSTVAAGIHAVCYSLPFLFLRPSLAAWAVIVGTHLLIDRFRLARYLVWAKNWLGAPRYWWKMKNGLLLDSDSPYLPYNKPDSATSSSNQNTSRPYARLPYGYGNSHSGWATWWHSPTPPFSECSATGYPSNRPAWLAVWLLILADNCCHILINGVALRWL